MKLSDTLYTIRHFILSYWLYAWGYYYSDEADIIINYITSKYTNISDIEKALKDFVNWDTAYLINTIRASGNPDKVLDINAVAAFILVKMIEKDPVNFDPLFDYLFQDFTKYPLKFPDLY